jgi:preprotein translocase subunit SecG
MEILTKLVYAVMLLSALGIIILVLLQHGKGADMGTGFGAGASGSLFGATGSANFLSRSTAVLAGLFFVCTMLLSYFASHRNVAPSSGLENLPSQVAPKPATAPPGGADGKLPASADPAPKPNDIPK